MNIVLQRKAYAKLMEWKEKGKKPLLVYGQRQIGKTYIFNDPQHKAGGLYLMSNIGTYGRLNAP